MAKEESAAILTIKEANNMTKKGKKQIANWLRQQADNLEKDGHLYAENFRARYLYATNK
jgi:hypothetical protein